MYKTKTKSRSKELSGYKKSKIVSTVLCGIATVAIIAFFLPNFIDVLTSVPDTEANIDLSNVDNAFYVVFAIIAAVVALAFYVPSTIIGAVGFVGTLKNFKGNKKIGDKIWFGILTFLPFIIEVLLILSIIIVL